MVSRSEKQEADAPTQLHGSRLTVARASWAAFTLVTLVIFAASWRARVPVLSSTTFIQDEYGPALAHFGISPLFLARYIATLEVTFSLVNIVLGLFAFWRKSDDAVVIFYSATAVGLGVFFHDLTSSLASLHPVWQTAIWLMRGLAFSAGVIFYYIFPDGRFYPGWARWLAAGWTTFALSWVFFPQLAPPTNKPSMDTPRDILLFTLGIGMLCSGALAQVLRYRRISGPVERQQTKWVMFGLSASALGFTAAFSPIFLIPTLRGTGPASLLAELLVIPAALSSLTLVPLAINFSILRYRLWDIDVLINRTLVYGLLTGGLAMVYFGGVVLLQRVLPARSPLAVVLSTLAIAALFNPLRRRIQEGIDRRFYRRKYDAEQTLARFSAVVRDQVELEALSASLLEVVQETMQPEQAWLWLREGQETADKQ